MKTKNGFTLIEFLVILILIGIISGFGIPQWNEYARRQKLINNTDELIADLKTAQAMAMAGLQDDPDGNTVKSFYVQSEEGSSTYWILRQLDSGGVSVVAQKVFDAPVQIKTGGWPGNPYFLVPTGKLVNSLGKGLSTSLIIEVEHPDVTEYQEITIEISGVIKKARKTT